MSGGSRSYEMARALARAGHDVHVITTWREEGISDRSQWFSEEIDGFNVHWLPVPYSNNMGFVGRMRAFVKFAYLATRRATEIGGDLVFGTSTPLTIAIPAVRASRKLGLPMVFEVRDLWPEVPIAVGKLKNPVLIFLARQLERYAYRNSTHVIALSPGMAEGVAATGFPRDSISTIPNMSNVELFRSRDQDAESFLQHYPQFRDKKLIVYTGALGEVNGVDYLVRVAGEMRSLDRDVQFLVAGSGKCGAALEKLAKELGVLGRNISFIDPLPKKDMPGLLAAATISCVLFVDIPELSNSSPNKFFDAVASQTPVVINWRGWLADLVRSRDAGIFVPPNEPVEAARQIAEFLNEPLRVERAAANAGAIARELFDQMTLTDRFVNVLEASRSSR